MRIHLLSDLHLEFGKMPRSYKQPDCDVVVLAGDIATGVPGVLWAKKKFDVPVIYVPGNHEFYGGRIHSEHVQRMQDKAAGSHVSVLDRGMIEIGGVRFLGATMWTDFGLYGTDHLSVLAAQQSMNDYRHIYHADRVPLRADDTRQMHMRSRYWLSEALRVPHEGQTVVVTHHAPSEQSIHPRYRGDKLTPAYASRLENLICDREPALWVHGHTHDSSDYMLCATRVVCNPRGYVGHELNPHFNPSLVLEI